MAGADFLLRSEEERASVAWKESLRFARVIRYHYDGGSSGNKIRININ